jgi:hypothetical protein
MLEPGNNLAAAVQNLTQQVTPQKSQCKPDVECRGLVVVCSVVFDRVTCRTQGGSRYAHERLQEVRAELEVARQNRTEAEKGLEYLRIQQPHYRRIHAINRWPLRIVIGAYSKRTAEPLLLRLNCLAYSISVLSPSSNIWSLFGVAGRVARSWLGGPSAGGGRWCYHCSLTLDVVNSHDKHLAVDRKNRAETPYSPRWPCIEAAATLTSPQGKQRSTTRTVLGLTREQKTEILTSNSSVNPDRQGADGTIVRHWTSSMSRPQDSSGNDKARWHWLDTVGILVR